MASLAVLVSLIFLSVIVVGPLTYIISLFRWMPNIIIYLLGIGCIFIGIWWLMLPIPAIKYYGIVDIFCGYKAIAMRQEKTTQG